MKQYALKKIIFFILPVITVILLIIISVHSNKFISQKISKLNEEKENPNDWMFMQRAFPYGKIDQETYINSLKIRNDLINKKTHSIEKSKFDNNWIFCGPTNIGGRITDIEMPLNNMQTIYAGIASGGLFKTTNTGATWSSIFDNELSLSIGDFAISKTDENTIYVGTGEANGGGGSMAYDGTGVYKTTNGGDTWLDLGLANIGSVGKVIVDPENQNRVFVAGMGRLFANNSERGVFRTTNGGLNWERVLYVSDSTGAIDLAINPLNPDTIYAAMWERIRRPNKNAYGGATSGIYRSTNGGNNWIELNNGLPNNLADKGRIGISIANSSPNILYALYAYTNGNLKGVYKTTNYGNNWFALNSSGIYSPSYMWWFGKIYTDPTNANKVFVTSMDAYKSEDGGNNWDYVFPEAHVDHHAFFIHPSNPNLVINGNDGGIYISSNGGTSSTKLNNLPITQFYTCDIDNNHPERLYGGAQDNSSMRTLTGNINDWEIIYDGDGFITLVDPSNNLYVYAEYQYGNFARSVDGGISFLNATNGINSSDRKNWNTPVVIDPINPSVLYYGANRLYKSTNRAVSWNVISGDLSNGNGGGNLVYGTITTISVSAIDNNNIYVGTDDGNLWVTQNAGTNWTKVSTALPQRWVTRVAADPSNAGAAYVTYSGYRYNSNTAYIYKTTNYGNNWISVTGDLPETPVNDIIIDPENHHLYIATDIGVFYSLNDGTNWNILGQNLPNLIITDMVYYQPSKMLVAATFGRSMYKYDLNDINNINNTIKDDFSVKVFPNPFSDKIQLLINAQADNAYNIQLYDIQGKSIVTIFDGKLNKGENSINFNANSLVGGIYYCKILSNKLLVKEIKLVHIK